MPSDLRSLAAFQEEIKDFRIVFCESTASTNRLAKELAEEGYPDKTLVIADSQYKGRGRRGRPWFSPGNSNIYMSLLLRPRGLDFTPQLITLSASLAVVTALNGLISFGSPDTAGGPAWPKWPNDIYWDRKKIGGVLTEAAFRMNSLSFLILGIGLNVNMDETAFPGDLAGKITSIKAETGKSSDRGELISEILRHFTNFYGDLFVSSSRLIRLWSGLSRTVNSPVRVLTAKGEISGVAVGIDGRGFLRVRKEGAEEVLINSADIEHLL
ncbi:bifunctional ligase/repressor BirA [bacterium BMS3Abin08]|nr:bifunctional ligase/repressor BirA [bacterium BMS3Abin08]